MENFEHFGINLRRLIIGKKYKTYQKAADDFEISLSYLNQLMKSEREPSMKVFKNILSKLNVSATEILSDPTTQQVPPAGDNSRPQPNLDRLEAKIDALRSEIHVPTADAKDLEDAAKWRAFEARIKPGGEDLVEKLLRVGEAELDFVREALGLEDRPHYAEAKRRAREKKKARIHKKKHSQSLTATQTPASPGRKKKSSV